MIGFPMDREGVGQLLGVHPRGRRRRAHDARSAAQQTHADGEGEVVVPRVLPGGGLVSEGPGGVTSE